MTDILTDILAYSPTNYGLKFEAPYFLLLCVSEEWKSGGKFVRNHVSFETESIKKGFLATWLQIKNDVFRISENWISRRVKRGGKIHSNEVCEQKFIN